MLKSFVQYLVAGLLTLPGAALAAGTVQLPVTSPTACFDGNGNPRDCVVGLAWPDPRFTSNANGTVTDGLTGLTWSKHANAPSHALPNEPLNACPNAETDMIWLDALDFIKCLNAKNHAGFSDWRLPNLNELESMVNSDAADTSAWLNANGFGFGPGLPNTQVQPRQYWTSTSDASDIGVPVISAASAWDVDLVKGDFPFSNLKNGVKRNVWPVRGVSTAPAQLWRTGQAVCYDDIGDSRLCTGTGEDGEKLAGAAWPTPRFLHNIGMTFALDRVSGLIWTTDTQTPGSRGDCPDMGLNVTWLEALSHVACLNAHAFLGRTDWRLPNRKELHSLADYSTGIPALTVGHPFEDRAGLTFWSATSNASAPNEAWVASLFDGSLSSAGKAATLPVWPVSGPDLLPPDLAITQGNMTTKVARQIISGTVEAGATVTVTNNGGAPAIASVTDGTWAFTIDPLADGVNNITVSATDFSQNIKTAAISITLDTGVPGLTMNPVTDLTNRKSHTLSGTVEAGTTVAVAVGATAVPVTLDNTGTNWSAVIPALAEGANTITVTATDAAGNTATLPLTTITLDTIPPVTTATPAPGNYTDSVAVTMATEAGSTIHYTADGTPVTTSSPVYSAPIRLAATTTTPFTVQFMAVDKAGNAEPVKNAAYLIHLGCDLNGDNKVDVRDALKALQISVGMFSATPNEMIRGDVGPLVNGKPNPNGVIDLADALVILQRGVGLVSPW